MKLKELAKLLLPPLVVGGLRSLRRALVPERRDSPAFQEWEYVPEGWRRVACVRGWNVDSVVQAQTAKWREFVRLTRGTGPLGIYHEAAMLSNISYVAHNTLMTYGYVLAMAARKRDRITLLDWGGGVGHYCVISRALMPDLEVGYHCRDVPLLCRGGRSLLPDARFHEDDDECFSRTYDLVLVSGSLHYWQDWKGLAQRLAGVSRPYLYVTRLPIVQRSQSFVTIQRPTQHGYDSEYLGWFLNRQEFLDHMQLMGTTLVREFLIEERPVVHGAPEQGEFRGFLFVSQEREASP